MPIYKQMISKALFENTKINSMKRHLLVVISLFLAVSMEGQDTTSILPENLRTKVYFNMPRTTFLQAFPAVEELSQRVSFRRVYRDKQTTAPLDYVVYYFDKDGHEPLYEVILAFTDTAARNEVAQQLLGPPNYKSTEWYVARDSAFDYSAWTFQNKLVIIGRIEGTEWAE